MRSRRFLAVLLVALGAGAALPGHAGMMSPCSDPIVLPGARVHVFILPHRAESALTARGRELATILQRHVLFAALKYRSIAVAELTGDADDCDFERASARVTPRLQAEQSAIFVWGRLFEQGDTIRLQTSVAFSVPGKPETFAWALGTPDGAKTRATVPSEPVMFAPRTIPMSYLQQLEAAQRESRRMRSEPRADASFWELPADPEARFGFVVIDVKDDWMHVRLFPDGGEGWIPAHSLAAADHLKGTFPELHFIDGLIGYHELVPGLATPPASQAAMLASTVASFDRYLEQSSGRAEIEARALARVLQGNATLRAAARPWSTAVLMAAQQHYRAARELAPTSTVASTFYLACGSALCSRGACSEGADLLHTQFLEAIARDPVSVELIDDLNAFYAAAYAAPASGTGSNGTPGLPAQPLKPGAATGKSIRLSTTPKELADRAAMAQRVQSSLH